MDYLRSCMLIQTVLVLKWWLCNWALSGLISSLAVLVSALRSCRKPHYFLPASAVEMNKGTLMTEGFHEWVALCPQKVVLLWEVVEYKTENSFTMRGTWTNLLAYHWTWQLLTCTHASEISHSAQSGPNKTLLNLSLCHSIPRRLFHFSVWSSLFPAIETGDLSIFQTHAPCVPRGVCPIDRGASQDP